MPNLTPEMLGFRPIEPHAWRINLRGRKLLLRELFLLDELDPIDDLQREAFSASDYDLIPANELVVVHETGGHVLAAYELSGETPGPMIAAGFAWGGFMHGRPRLVSDFLGVRLSARSFGIGEAMKRLQAAIAVRDGFQEVVWTVDPLRAANARLNFAKLGAVSHHYERNRYGEAFAAAHYGGLPTDRVHLVWPVHSPRVIALLTGQIFAADRGPTRFVALPDDIDRLMAESRDEALRWRLQVRDALETHFADGWEIDGFVSAGIAGADPALVLHRRSEHI